MFRARSSTPSGILPPGAPLAPPPPSGSLLVLGAAGAPSSPPRGSRSHSQRALLRLRGGAAAIGSAVSGLGSRSRRCLAAAAAAAAAAAVLVVAGGGAFFFSVSSSSGGSAGRPRRASFDLLLLDPSGEIDRRNRQPKPSWLTPECRSAVDKLERAHIRLVAFDFDMTLVDVHTGGRWEGGADELARHVRPDFRCYVAHAMDRGLQVSVATFSTQKDLISRVLRMSIPKDDRGMDRVIPVFGGDDYVPEFEIGKQSQLALSIQHFAEQQDVDPSGADGGDVDSKEADALAPSHTLLVDDDARNIGVAMRDGYATLHYLPDATRLFDADLVTPAGDGAFAFAAA